MSAMLRNKWVLAILALALVATLVYVTNDYHGAVDDVADWGEDIVDNIFDGVEGATYYLRQLISGLGETTYRQIRGIQVAITNMLFGAVNSVIATINKYLPGNPIPELPYMDFH